jgi:electron transfer flavoprotein alpha subunit
MNGDVLVVAEHLRGELKDVTRELISAGAELKDSLGGRLIVAVISNGPAALVGSVSLEGVDEVVQATVSDEEFNADTWVAVLEALISERSPAVILIGSTANGLAVGPALAVRRRLGFASDVIGLSVQDGTLTARREFYGGKTEAELEFPASIPVMLLLRPTTWRSASGTGSPEVTPFSPSIASERIRTRHIQLLDPEPNDVDLSGATAVMAIGRGIGDRENVGRLSQLAARLGMTLAASRPLIDAGFLPQSRLVGQSGATVKPKLYLALGISGASQHAAGMKASETILAVNTDPRAPIFAIAHYAGVVDLFQVVDELERLADQ